LPAGLRALLSGLVVFQVLQAGWYVAFVANTKYWPSVPWSVPLGCLWLWVLFRYFNGRGWPESTAAARAKGMRAPPLGAEAWRWALAYVVLFFLFLVSVIQVVYRFVSIPDDGLDLSMLPWWTLYPSLILLSINAGISEEAGFRGYLQGGLERRYGPIAAVVVTSLIFWLAHLNHASGAARVALLLAMSVGLGALARCAGSIRPAIVAHSVVDSVFFVAAASGTTPWFLEHPRSFAETGVDASFIGFSVLWVVVLVAGVRVLGRLVELREKRESSRETN